MRKGLESAVQKAEEEAAMQNAVEEAAATKKAVEVEEEEAAASAAKKAVEEEAAVAKLAQKAAQKVAEDSIIEKLVSAVVNELFDDYDVDGSGKIGNFDELQQLSTNVRHTSTQDTHITA